MDDKYKLHQTPVELAKDLIALVALEAGDRVVDPFKGDGAFYNNYPSFIIKDWAEITQGRDYQDISGTYDWVITNPPFQLDTGEKKVNSFWFLLDYYSTRAVKGIAFLGNDACFGTITPRRMKILSDRGWAISGITVCAVKKWRGRYFWIVLEKKPNTFIKHLLPNYA